MVWTANSPEDRIILRSDLINLNRTVVVVMEDLVLALERRHAELTVQVAIRHRNFADQLATDMLLLNQVLYGFRRTLASGTGSSVVGIGEGLQD